MPPQINEPGFHFYPEQLITPLKPTIKEILEQYLKNPDSGDYVEMFQKVLDCGTGKLGFNIKVCDNCAETDTTPLPCSSCLCPDCQKENFEQWVEKRSSELLPVPYYQGVFSLPDRLSVFAMYNKRIVFDFMFNAVSSALKKIPKEKKIKIGFIVVLQTWASSLWFDPHMHVCIPGVGILEKNGKLNHYPSKESLPFNESILSKEFKKVFLEKLDAHYFKENIDEYEKINWPDEMKSIGENELSFKKWINELEEEWDVNLGDSTTIDAKHLISYVGRRLPISDDQILGVESGRVLFQDTKDKAVSLTIEDFVKRLAKHALPSGYHRIRNYGFLSNSTKKESLKRICEELGTTFKEPEKTSESCKACHKGHMLSVGLILKEGGLKICEKNINRLKSKPDWIDQLKIAKNFSSLQAEVRIFLVNKMMKYPLTDNPIITMLN